MDGDRIRRVRANLGLNQTQLGAILGIDVKTLCRYEKGHAKPGQWLSDVLQIFERASEDAKVMRELRDLRDTEVPALLWFLLDKVYRAKLRA